MAQHISEASPSPLPFPNWFEIHANPMASWNTMNRWLPPPVSASEEDMSNISTSHSSLTVDASITSEPVENQLWNQVLLGAGGEMHNNHDDCENFLDLLSSKNTSNDMFDPACDSSWEFTNRQSPINGLEKQLNSFSGLPGPTRNWSVAPPNPQIDHGFAPSATNMFINYAVNCQIKHETPTSQSTYLPYLHEIQEESQRREIASHFRPLSSCNPNIVYQVGPHNYFTGINSNCSNNTRNLTDLISSSSLNTPMELHADAVANPPMEGPDLTDTIKQGHESSLSSQTRGNGRSPRISADGKNKRAEENLQTIMKKSKQVNSTLSSCKIQAPKVKLGDRISALQQIVSPFGKTDTASVLLEAIKYITFLHEQVQLQSDPYMKSGPKKDHNRWSGLGRNEKTEQTLDLRSKGLCLVPVSCTPQACRENNGHDFWTPTYRGCMFR